MQLRVRLNREINQISDQRSFSAVYVERATEFEENAVFQVSSKRPLSPNDARFTRSHSKRLAIVYSSSYRVTPSASSWLSFTVHKDNLSRIRDCRRSATVIPGDGQTTATYGQALYLLPWNLAGSLSEQVDCTFDAESRQPNRPARGIPSSTARNYCTPFVRSRVILSESGFIYGSG